MADDAYYTVADAKGALEHGKQALWAAADAAAANKDDTSRKQLEFCAGALIGIQQTLTVTTAGTELKPGGVNPGCKG